MPPLIQKEEMFSSDSEDFSDDEDWHPLVDRHRRRAVRFIESDSEDEDDYSHDELILRLLEFIDLRLQEDVGRLFWDQEEDSEDDYSTDSEFSDEEMEAGSEKEEEGDLLEHLTSLFIQEQSDVDEEEHDSEKQEEFEEPQDEREKTRQ